MEYIPFGKNEFQIIGEIQVRAIIVKILWKDFNHQKVISV